MVVWVYPNGGKFPEESSTFKMQQFFKYLLYVSSGDKAMKNVRPLHASSLSSKEEKQKQTSNFNREVGPGSVGVGNEEKCLPCDKCLRKDLM